jgi:hypothetical protein
MRVASLVLVMVGACAFDRSGVPSDGGFVDPNDDGGGVSTTWRTDTGAEWGAEGATFDGATVEAWGALGPTAYLTGGLLARGSDARLFSSIDGDVWPVLSAAASTGLGVTVAAPVDLGYGRPRGIGITGGDDFTYWFEGELWLDAGEQTLSLYGDDMAFVDLAPPGGTFSRAVGATWPNATNTTYTAAAAGWYGIRVGMAEGIGTAGLDFQLQGPGATALAPIPAERLRVRADLLTGLTWSVFDDEHLVAPVGWYLFDGDGFDFTPNDAALAELGVADHDHLSMRWAGQFRVDTAGTYALELDTDDGQRLWIDGNLALDFFGDPSTHTAAVVLDAGWHDLVADLTDDTGGQFIKLTVTSGPAGVGMPIAAAMLRPVEPRQERTYGLLSKASASIPDIGEVQVSSPVPAPSGAIAIAVELSVTIDHPHWQALEIAVVAPDGSAYLAAGAGSSTLTGADTALFTVPTPGEAALGNWTLRIRDTAAGELGTLQTPGLTVRYRGGTPPISALAVWQSPILDLGDPVGLDAITWAGRLPPDAMSARVRTCDEPTECAGNAWSDPVTVSGGKPTSLARKYAQLEVQLASDGDQTPSADWIELTYRTAGQ